MFCDQQLGHNWQRVFACLRERSGACFTKVQVTELHGGLENCGIFAVTASSPVEQRAESLVVKRMTGCATRELHVYQTLANTAASDALPQLLGHHTPAAGEVWMYLERIVTPDPWPWADTSASIAVLEQLAKLHSVNVQGEWLREWNYEKELRTSAESTLDLFASGVAQGLTLGDRPMIRALERGLQTLPSMRVALNSWHPPVLVHGDAHAGNAMIRPKDGRMHAILLDWARARFGSPLEDVSSWLQSVGYWDPEVRRRHDTLVRSYLVARGLPDQLTPEFRELYWIAAACNAMSGALRYHLAVAMDEHRSDVERQEGFRAVRHWLRIIHRADSCWRN